MSCHLHGLIEKAAEESSGQADKHHDDLSSRQEVCLVLENNFLLPLFFLWPLSHRHGFFLISRRVTPSLMCVSVIGVIMVMLVLVLVLVMRIEPIRPVMFVLDPFPGFVRRHPPQRILRVYRVL
jgi:hypothetical protein